MGAMVMGTCPAARIDRLPRLCARCPRGGRIDGAIAPTWPMMAEPDGDMRMAKTFRNDGGDRIETKGDSLLKWAGVK